MNHNKLMAMTMSVILAATTAACGAEGKEPSQPVIETVEREDISAQTVAQDEVAEGSSGQQADRSAQETSADQQSPETNENNTPSGPLKPELVAGSAPKLPITVSFPDWRGRVDNTLALNSMYSFYGYHGQGELFLTVSGRVESFDMFVNGTPVDTKEITSLGDWRIDISSVTKNGENTVQVSNIVPSSVTEAVIVHIPYPEVIDGTPEEEGIRPEALQLISDLIETDIENGFTSAQLSVVRNGRLIYENAWGKTNTYQPNGLPNTDSKDVTTDTLYDLASVTKMFSVNYALQKLVTDGEIDLDDKITKYLGDGFVTDTIQVTTDSKGDPKDPASLIDLDTIKKWKSELTVRELLKHQGGFPADPKYCAPQLYKDGLGPGEDYPENPLFAGNVPSEETKQATVEMICKTPLDYKPGTKTVYSDADYMILGLVVEKVTGQDLDTYLKKTFYEPMGLTHITYNPLRNGFSKDDCAATELNGNTRDGLLNFDGYRTETIQGEVHDEKAFYSMDGISGHAGLFSNATDLARLASVMLTGGYGENGFFSPNIIDMFTSPKEEDAANWGLGWWRQGENQRVWYFGTQAGSETFGHQGWTGTIVMVDPDRDLIIVYLTNKKNSRVTNTKADANKFDGDWYTSATLGFVPQILSVGMDTDVDIMPQLQSLTQDMATESVKLLPKKVSIDSSHPAARNARSKQQLAELYK